MLGWFSPFMNDPGAVLPAYVRSLHRNWDGEWDFDLSLKPLMGFPAYFGWVGAIFAAHAKVHAGLSLDCPVLSMYSDEADMVLDWKQVSRWSRTLGRDVTALQFPGGLHDLVLSRRGGPRERLPPACSPGRREGLSRGCARSVGRGPRTTRSRNRCRRAIR